MHAPCSRVVPASAEEIVLNAPHRPHANALEAFGVVLHDIKAAIVASRRHWDAHEPKMWARAAGIADADLVVRIPHHPAHREVLLRELPVRVVTGGEGA